MSACKYMYVCLLVRMYACMPRHVARLKFKRRQLHRPLAKSWSLRSLVNGSSSRPI